MGIAFVVLCVILNTVGDVAAKHSHNSTAIACWIGSAFGWLQVMKRLPVGWSSVFYSMVTIVVAVSTGILVLKEPVTLKLIIGTLLAIASILVLR